MSVRGRPDGVRAVRAALRSCFATLERARPTWEQAVDDCRVLLVSLANLADQMECLREADLRSSLLISLPDLKSRLRAALIRAAEALRRDIDSHAMKLQTLRDEISREWEICWQRYEEHAADISWHTTLERSPTCPALADMLEWMDTAEKQRRKEFFTRKVLLQRICYDDLAYMKRLPDTWAQVAPQRDKAFIHDTLVKVSFFLEEKG
uniref:AFG2-interacting ribosome maturation factor-like n=1 Tax=Myxine glutinosa TaxID=7769 RepID=UPI00358FF51B